MMIPQSQPLNWRRSRELKSVCAALLALSCSIDVAHSQAATSSPSVRDRADVRTFSIPEQPLATALITFAEQSGVQFSLGSDHAEGRRSAALNGQYSIGEALSRLLNGTGLTYRFTSEKTVVIEKGSNSRSRTLGPVRVEGAATAAAVNGVNGSRDVTSTEGSGSFTTGAMTIGSKSPRSIKDTSQSVSVITAEQIAQQNINDFNQALKQAPGISSAQGGSSLETTFYSRGFEVTSIQVDGGAPFTTNFVQQGTGIAFFPQIDLSQYDHVEVLRGSAGLFNGYGDPSGTINLVRKKPLDHEQATVDAEVGSWEHYRTTLDTSAPLWLDGALRGRLVVTWQSNEHFYELADDRKTLLYGVLDYDLTPSTLITAGISQTSQESRPWYSGLPRYQSGEDLRLPRKTALMMPWNRWDFDTTEVFSSIEQQFGEDWRAKLNLTRNEQSSTQKIGYSSGTVNPIDGRGPRLAGSYNEFGSDQFAAEATVSGAFTLFGQRQEVTFGINRSDQDGGGRIEYSSLVTSSATAPYQPYPGGPLFCTTVSVCPTGIASPPIDVFAFNPYDLLYTEPRNPVPTTVFSVRGQVKSLAYANLRLTLFDDFHLETGLRWSRYENKIDANGSCVSIPTSGTPGPTNCVGRQIGDAYNFTHNRYQNEETSSPPSVALSYDVTDQLVTYLSYADIYQDQSNRLAIGGAPVGPVKGENIELGLKWAARDGKFNAALSVYQIQQRGFAQRDTSLPPYQPDPSRVCCYFQHPDQTNISEGVDSEVTGEILPGWQLSASYTVTRNRSEGLGFPAAVRDHAFLTIQPEHLYKLWRVRPRHPRDVS